MTIWCLQPALGTCKGHKPHNEDAVNYTYPLDTHTREASGALFVVADGVSSSRYGRVASRVAVSEVIARYYDASGETIEARLVAAVRQVNRLLYDQYHGRGKTTLTAAVFHGDDIVVASVGDSRAYWIKHGLIQRLTTDHVVPVSGKRRGDIVNKLERAMGHSMDVQPDTRRITVGKRGSLLLVTDGITYYLKDDALRQITNQNEPAAAVEEIIRRAYRAGGGDNMSIAVINVISEAVNEKAAVAHIQEVLRYPIAHEFVGDDLTPHPLPLDGDPGGVRVHHEGRRRRGTRSAASEPGVGEWWLWLVMALVAMGVIIAISAYAALTAP